MRRPPITAVATPGIWLAQASLSLPTRRSRLPRRAPQSRLPWSSHAHPPNMDFSERPRVLPRVDFTSSSRLGSRGIWCHPGKIQDGKIVTGSCEEDAGAGAGLEVDGFLAYPSDTYFSGLVDRRFGYI